MLLTFMLFIFFSCDQSGAELTKNEMLDIVNANNELLSNCFKEGDADKLANMYTDSAKLCPNGYGFVYGKDSIRAFWADDFKIAKTLEMNTQVLTVDGDANVIYETGKATSSFLINDTTYSSTVKYINIWRKQQDGSYKLDVDFWNKDRK